MQIIEFQVKFQTNDLKFFSYLFAILFLRSSLYQRIYIKIESWKQITCSHLFNISTFYYIKWPSTLHPEHFSFFSVYLMYIYMHIYEYNNEVSGKAEWNHLTNRIVLAYDQPISWWY